MKVPDRKEREKNDRKNIWRHNGTKLSQIWWKIEFTKGSVKWSSALHFLSHWIQLKTGQKTGVAICRLKSSRHVGEDKQVPLNRGWVYLFFFFCIPWSSLKAKSGNQNEQRKLQKPSSSILKSKMLSTSARIPLFLFSEFSCTPASRKSFSHSVEAATVVKRSLTKTPKEKTFLFSWRSCGPCYFFLSVFSVHLNRVTSTVVGRTQQSGLNKAWDFWLEDW